MCNNKYNEFINLYLASKKKEIEIIYEALEKNKIDVANHLLLRFESIPSIYFENSKSLTQIAIPNTI